MASVLDKLREHTASIAGVVGSGFGPVAALFGSRETNRRGRFPG